MKSKFTPRVLVAALVLTLGAAATAFAVGPDHERCGGDRMEHRMGYGMKDMSRLHDDLKLDAKQETLWQDAQKAAQGNRSELREQMRKQREDALAKLNQPGADLRAIVKQMDEAREAGRKQHEASHDRWLAVYDSLNPEQKEKARLFFKSKLERMGHLRDGGKGGPGRG